MKTVQLPCGLTVSFDDEDESLFMSRGWYVSKSRRTSYLLSTNRPTILFHRLILKAQPGQLIDHRDGNGLNNCRSNLRFCSHKENMRNRRWNPASKRPAKGIEVTECGRYRARITADGVRRSLGSFPSLESAKAAYAMAATELHGAFASF